MSLKGRKFGTASSNFLCTGNGFSTVQMEMFLFYLLFLKINYVVFNFSFISKNNQLLNHIVIIALESIYYSSVDIRIFKSMCSIITLYNRRIINHKLVEIIYINVGIENILLYDSRNV